MVARIEAVVKERFTRVAAFEEPVLEHFGKSRFHLLERQSAEERSGNNNIRSLIEHPDFVFQTAEIDACFATDGSIDGAEQSGGDVDERNAAFKSACSKSAKVGYHASAEVNHQRVASAAGFTYLCPYRCERVEIFVNIAGLEVHIHGIGNIRVVSQ